MIYDSDKDKETKLEQGRSASVILDRNENKDVAVLLGAGSMGMAILRRVAAGKKILLGGRRQSSLDRAAGAYLLGPDAGFVTGTDLLIDGGTIAALKSGLVDLRVR